VIQALPDAPYTLRSIEEMLGLGRSVITGLITAGFVSPSRGARNEYRFSFQDVVLLRTAYHLQAANIPARRMVRSLKQLKERLPNELPLSGLRITAIGNDVAVRDGDAHWEAGSGQLLMDFEVAATQGTVSFLQRGPTVDAGNAVRNTREPSTAAQWFSRGEQLEGQDDEAAEHAYRQAIALDADHAHAYLNLGAMLCDAGRCAQAVELYDDALTHCPDAPLLHFNQAIALEDQHRDSAALKSYERCLELAPELADAHYNAARLHEKLGDARAALRHYSAYRRLER
jgi:tetratricopeptide (TPR) repeat protein